MKGGGGEINEETKKRKIFFFFLDQRVEKVSCHRPRVDRIWAVGSLDDRLVRRIYSFGESSPPPRGPRRQARSASRNRVESRSQDTDTSTFPRQFRSAGSTPLVHSCATPDCTWFAAHALSSRTRLHAHIRLPRNDYPRGLSAFFPLSLHPRGISCSPSCTIFLVGTRREKLASK